MNLSFLRTKMTAIVCFIQCVSRYLPSYIEAMIISCHIVILEPRIIYLCIKFFHFTTSNCSKSVLGSRTDLEKKNYSTHVFPHVIFPLRLSWDQLSLNNSWRIAQIVVYGLYSSQNKIGILQFVVFHNWVFKTKLK